MLVRFILSLTVLVSSCEEGEIRGMRPSEDENDVPGYLDESEETASAGEPITVTVGNAKATILADTLQDAASATVRLRRLSDAGIAGLNSEAQDLIAERVSESVVEINFIDPRTNKPVSSEVLASAYLYSDALLGSLAGGALKAVIIVDPGKPNEKIVLSRAKHDETGQGLRLASEFGYGQIELLATDLVIFFVPSAAAAKITVSSGSSIQVSDSPVRSGTDTDTGSGGETLGQAYDSWFQLEQGTAPLDNYEQSAATIVTDGSQVFALTMHPMTSVITARRLDLDNDNGWQLITPANNPPQRRDGSAVLTDGKVWIYGGESGGQYQNNFATYDPVGNSWDNVSAAGAPDPGFGGKLCAYNSTTIVVFGIRDTGGLANTHAGIFDITSRTWRAIDAGQIGADNAHLFCTADGKAHAISNTGLYSIDLTDSNSAWEYVQISGPPSEINTGGTFAATTPLGAIDGSIWLAREPQTIGGSVSQVATVYRYRITEGDWMLYRSDAVLTKPLKAAVIASTQDFAVFIGKNASSQNETRETVLFRFATQTWSKADVLAPQLDALRGISIGERVLGIYGDSNTQGSPTQSHAYRPPR